MWIKKLGKAEIMEAKFILRMHTDKIWIEFELDGHLSWFNWCNIPSRIEYLEKLQKSNILKIKQLAYLKMQFDSL